MTTYNKLYENWINSLNEEDEDSKELERKAKRIGKVFQTQFHNQDYQSAVKWLSQVADSSQTKRYMAISGQLDGDAGDDQFSVENDDIACSELYPTQNEVGVDGSLSFPLGWAAGPEKGAKAFIYAMNDEPKIINKAPIVVFQGKFVIDGHHRWSSTYCMNPKAVMQTVNLKNSAIEDPKEVLKAVQVAIAKEIGKVPMSKAEGDNLFEVSPKALEKMLQEKIPKEWYGIVKEDQATMNKLELEKGNEKGLRVKILEWVPKNVGILQEKAGTVASNYGPRTTMPQTDNAKNWISNLKSGGVDVAPPYVGDVTDPKSKSFTGAVKESLNISNQCLRQIVLEEIRRSKK
jgi:hypothetical protein